MLLELDYYGIWNKILDWIKAFLTQRQQRVVDNGSKSEKDAVLSSVPQGTVPGPHDFIAFITDIAQDTASNIRLFEDDCSCIIYRSVKKKRMSKSFEMTWTGWSLGHEV